MHARYLVIIFFLGIFQLQAQESMYKTAWLEKWQNSKAYLIAVVEKMPDSLYDFKPTEREMSFAGQLQHINANMEWLASTYFEKPKTEVNIPNPSKAQLIEHLKASFDAVYNRIKAFPENRLAEQVDFFAGEKNRLQILYLLQDHVTHHRGQLIVYLNLNGLKPPPYSGW